MTPPKRSRVGVCVPTVRPEQIAAFIERWTPLFDASPCDVALFVHEDRPERSPIEMNGRHTCHADIDGELGADGWVIPRGSGACRSFPMLLAYRAGCDFVLCLDDDCLPVAGGADGFLDEHLAAFRKDRWFRTVEDDVRGVPYENRGTLPVLLNHGVWTGVPDLDGPTSVVRMRGGSPTILRAASEVIPPGMWFPLCAMNVCYDRTAIPAAYNLLMGLDDVGFDRFDDIWSGLFLKRIADHLGLFITNGTPFVHHSKASNPFVNMRKEALGIHLHESLWRHVAAAPLRATSIAECYRELAESVARFPDAFPSAPAPAGYFQRLSRAMSVWVDLTAAES